MNSPVDNRSTVHELIEQRERLRGWIAKLDEVRGDANQRVAERVRGDYEARLQSVTEELSTHREELERDLAARQADLNGAEERRVSVGEALDEVRLRHLIGELDGGAWEEARPDLERAVEEADAALAATRADVDDLAHLVEEIRNADEAAASVAATADARAEDRAAPAEEAPTPADAAPESEPPPAESPASAPVAEAPTAPEPAHAESDAAEEEPVGDPFGEDLPVFPPADATPASPAGRDPFGDEFPGGDGAGDDDDLPWLETLERKTAEWESGTSSESGLEFLDRLSGDKPPAGDSGIAEDDLAFLEELDRAIAGNPGAATPPSAPKASDLPTQPAGAAPAGRLICKECGAPNEPHAWYCEVCGSEL
ncbi:MAG: hypothetical protein JWM27_1171 [Gemmatimonadetes bacterium]|nr:hypothetical protein [Gemmatimonadota bacterium]